MKKLFITIIGIFILNASIAQSYNKVYKTTLIKYEYGEWVDQESNYPEKMFVILDGKEIKITNEPGTKIIVYGDADITKSPSGNVYSWRAYDKDGNDCLFLMKRFVSTGNTLFTISYISSGVGVEFYTSKD